MEFKKPIPLLERIQTCYQECPQPFRVLMAGTFQSMKRKGNMDPIIIFVCEHGAAKSIIAAAYFNKLARENSLSITGAARGTQPDPELSSKTVAGLRVDGLAPTESIPAKLTRDETDSAQRVVSFCELPEEYRQEGIVEYWQDVPPVSENYKRARDAILKHLQELLNNL